MTQISRRFIKPEVEQKIDTLFHKSISLCTDKISSEFLSDLLTPTERTMLGKRLAIAYLLLKGNSYESIKSTLKVSAATISHVAQILLLRGKGLRNILQSITKNEEFKQLLEEIGYTAADIFTTNKYVNRPKHTKTNEPF